MSYTTIYTLGPTSETQVVKARLYTATGDAVGAAVAATYSPSALWHVFAMSIPDGHAGYVKFFDDNTGDILALSAINAAELENADAKTSAVASDVRGELASEIAQLAAIKTKTDALDVSDVTVTSFVDGSTLTVYKALTFSATISGLTIPADWVTGYLTVKTYIDDADSEAILQLVVSNPADANNDGVLTLNGAEASEDQRTEGVLTLTQATGVCTLSLTDDLTDELIDHEASLFLYDIKVVDGNSDTTELTTGNLNLGIIVTQALE